MRLPLCVSVTLLPTLMSVVAAADGPVWLKGRDIAIAEKWERALGHGEELDRIHNYRITQDRRDRAEARSVAEPSQIQRILVLAQRESEQTGERPNPNGRREAIEHHQRVLEQLKQQLGADHPSVRDLQEKMAVFAAQPVSLREEQEEPKRDAAGRPRHDGRERDASGLHQQMERVRALHEAAERLNESGLHDMSRELHHRAEQLEEEIHRHRQQQERQPQHRPDPAVRELQEQMHELRRDVRELHHKLDMIIDYVEHEREEDEREEFGREERRKRDDD